jgi:pyridoxamine 5'-phosphate oxidase
VNSDGIETAKNPISLFEKLYLQVCQSDIDEPSSVVLATAAADGKPSARVVLLKDFNDNGFVIYTNLESRKGRELSENPYAALCFYWEVIHYQVRIEGSVARVADAEADVYFASRPRGSQIGAWVSRQSEPLQSRAVLDAKAMEIENRLRGSEITRPPFWSGYRIAAARMEFWKRRDNRLHDRIVYFRQNNEWIQHRMYP